MNNGHRAIKVHVDKVQHCRAGHPNTNPSPHIQHYSMIIYLGGTPFGVVVLVIGVIVLCGNCPIGQWF